MTETYFSSFLIFQSNDDSNDKYPSYSPMSIDWPSEIGQIYSAASEESKSSGDDDVQRPDSGVGESVSSAFFSFFILQLVYNHF